MKQKLAIGHPLQIPVHWYDNVPVPARHETKEGEVIGWRAAQVLIRVSGYAVVRFWKKSGREVGNPDHERRGWKIELRDLSNSQEEGIDINLDG